MYREIMQHVGKKIHVYMNSGTVHNSVEVMDYDKQINEDKVVLMKDTNKMVLRSAAIEGFQVVEEVKNPIPFAANVQNFIDRGNEYSHY